LMSLLQNGAAVTATGLGDGAVQTGADQAPAAHSQVRMCSRRVLRARTLTCRNRSTVLAAARMAATASDLSVTRRLVATHDERLVLLRDADWIRHRQLHAANASRSQWRHGQRHVDLGQCVPDECCAANWCVSDGGVL